MKCLAVLKVDYFANLGNRKGLFLVLFFRASRVLYQTDNWILKLIGVPFRKLYRIVCKWIMGVEIPEQTKIGEGLKIWHGQGIVINHNSVIGSNVLIRHTTTIGNKYKGSGCPVIGDNVDIGAHVIILGDIKIGNNVIIGAGSVVTKSIPDNRLAYGNPLIVKERNDLI
jgi:Serine acetyltransferase